MESKLDRHQQSLMSYYLPNPTALRKLSGFYSLFADPSRVKILSALCIAELCVTDIARYCNMEQSTVSHQLQQLRAAQVVSTTRCGKVIYYKICSPYIAKTLEVGSDYLSKN